MNQKNISPNPQQPVDRVPAGQLPTALAELSEEAIATQALPHEWYHPNTCSHDGDDE
ncbi:DUF5837 family cyanobactin class RiPP [Lyngbya sp. CCY1209]|uniref:DUF5837 family cyanobactin class RiPP n=1 Tax=Lyngbya sp. CCY1209 TaxID=2886103 RepID=UPI002D1FDD5F|nr:DUF5837 family cyanobactin class RiPP [Lyngbya sp. CCY1209]MEB3883425.1 DUF5837 family protein [Lyngbya sp. CCY1209]